MDVMVSDCASVQVLAPDGASLNLLAWKHLDPASAAFWQRVTADKQSTCGRALRDNRRVFITDVEACEFMSGTRDLLEYRRSRIRAVQSTPLHSRTGQPVGMLSTHWHTPHTANADRFRLFDVLARQAADLIERSAAEEAGSRVSQRLIEAHEAERLRVALELHDGINPRLLMLNMQLAELTRDPAVCAPETLRKIEDACAEVEQIGRAVQAVSYRLHPPRLQFLSAAAAADSLCREVSQKHGVHVCFRVENIPDNLSTRIRVCLYRVLQEALQNAVTHSGASTVEVMLRRDGEQIELAIDDTGVGFDLAANRRGLGLASMKERLKAVNGDLVIRSFPQRGTWIRAHVPVRTE
jgi:signal transduction histidine kinase